MSFDVIDFHTHPFALQKNNICNYKDSIPMSADSTRALFDRLGVSRICGSVVEVGGVLYDDLLTDAQKEKILFTNAKKLLCC